MTYLVGCVSPNLFLMRTAEETEKIMGCMYRMCQNYGTPARSAVFVFYEYEDGQVVTTQLASLYGEYRHWHSACWMLMRMIE